MNFETAQRQYFAREGIDPRSRWVDLSLSAAKGVQLVHTQVLETGTGRPVVLVHGGGGLSAAWAPLMARLRSVRVLAADRPGCGASSGFDYRGSDLRAHAVHWCTKLFDALEIDSALIVANSMGARWATWFALSHPRRVEGLALFGIPAMLLETSAPIPMRLLGVRGLGRLMMALEPPGPRSSRALWQRMGHDPDQLVPELLALVEAATRQPEYGPTWRSLLSTCVELRGARPGLSLNADELRRLECPVTLAVGDRDPFGAVEVARRAVSYMPDGVLEVAGTGHLPWLDEPTRYAEIVDEVIARTSGSTTTTNGEAASR